MPKTRPDFIIISAMKAATSTLHEQLALQPGIFMSTPKEPNFFSDDAQFARGHDWYANLFAAADPHGLCGESSTHYTKLPTYPATVARLKEYAPGAKLIYIMRNPIDRLLSHYIHEWTQRVISEPPGQALVSHPEMTAYSQYALQLRPYLLAFGPAAILPVFFEKLTTNPELEFERICRFLDYRGTPTWKRELPPQNVSRMRVRAGPWLSALIQQPVLKTLRRTLIPSACREWVKKIFRMESNPYLSELKINRLKVTFDDDLRILSSWVGLPISCDTWQEVATTRSPVLQPNAVA